MGAPIRNLGTTVVSSGSQKRRLACALFEQETIARARNDVRSRVHGSGSEKLIGNDCLSWLQLQMFQKNVRQRRKGQCQKQISHDLTRPGQRPGEFDYML